LLYKSQKEGEHKYPIDGLQAEFPSQHLNGSDEQQTVDDEEGVFYREPCALKDN
jgi:hypothetical protein